MKFEKFLNKEAVPEWRPKYLNYHLLKEHLRNIPMNQAKREIEEEFCSDLKLELKKISLFYAEKEREVQAKWSVFSAVMSKRDLINFYTEIDLLKSFQSLNVTATRKILKKFAKVTGNAKEAAYFLVYEAESCPFWNSSNDDLADNIEDLFTSKYSGGDRHRAMRRLRLRNFKSETFHASALLAGLFWGSSIVGIFYLFMNRNSMVPLNVSLLTLLFLPFLAIGLFSLNTYVFNSSYVNYRFVFQFDKRSALHECQYFSLTGLLAFTFIFTTICVRSSKTLLVLPLIATIIVFLNPISWLWPHSRLWMLKILFRIISAPFFAVEFKDFFINDHLISLGPFFQAILRSCGFASDHVSVKLIPIAPYIPRILQCFRRFHDTKMTLNLLNALKYALKTLTIVLKCFVSNHKIPLTLLQCVNSLFSLYWDNVMNFGFLKLESKNILLRTELVLFRYKIVYYYMFFYNVLARFTWIIPFYYENNTEMITLILVLIEVVRRFHWTFLRIEYEHLNNCNSFRAVDNLKAVRSDDLFYKDMVYESRDKIEAIEGVHGDDNSEEQKNDYEFTELIDSV